MTLGDKLRFYRTAAGYAQSAVAREIGRSRTTYTYYETGRNEPSVRSLYIIARFLGCRWNIWRTTITPPSARRNFSRAAIVGVK